MYFKIHLKLFSFPKRNYFIALIRIDKKRNPSPSHQKFYPAPCDRELHEKVLSPEQWKARRDEITFWLRNSRSIVTRSALLYSQRLLRARTAVLSQPRLLSHGSVDAGGHGPPSRGTERDLHVEAGHIGIFGVLDVHARYPFQLFI